MLPAVASAQFRRAHRMPHSPIEEPPEPGEQGDTIDPDDGEADEPVESPERPRPHGKRSDADAMRYEHF